MKRSKEGNLFNLNSESLHLRHLPIRNGSSINISQNNYVLQDKMLETLE